MYNIVYFHISYFNEVHHHTPDWLKCILRKFLKHDKLFDLEILKIYVTLSKFKLTYTDINFIKTIFESPTPPFKMDIRLGCTEVDIFKNTKNHELQN